MLYYDRRTAWRMLGLAALGMVGTPARSRGAPPLGIAPGMQFPDLIYRTEAGAEQSIAASRGKVTLVYFWAVWCPICYNDIVNIQALYDEFKTDPSFALTVLNIMDDYRKGVAWARGRSLTMPLNDFGMEGRRATTARLASGTYQFPRSTPQFYLLDRTGTVAVAVSDAVAGTAANQAAIHKLLAGSA